jgi:hypothetical protein
MSVGKLSGLLGTQTYQRAVKFGTFRGEQTPKNAAVLDPVQGISPVYNTQKRATFQADFTQDKIDVDLLLRKCIIQRTTDFLETILVPSVSLLTISRTV